MRDFSIDLIWAKIQVAITAVGGWIGWFLGGVDGMLIALIVLMTLDYLSGVMCAIADKKLSSAVGFKGICKKVLILMLVGVANIIDVHVVGTGAVLRGAVICFYLSNEGLSLLENAAYHVIYWTQDETTNRTRTLDNIDVEKLELFLIGQPAVEYTSDMEIIRQ